jgi:hypothetical protein
MHAFFRRYLPALVICFAAVFAVAQEDAIEWRFQAKHGNVVLTGNPLGQASRSAFYAARGFSAETIRPYAQACGFSFGMQNGGHQTLTTQLTDWVAIGADGESIPLRLPEAWDTQWEKDGVSPSARIAFRWAQFQTANTFEPGDWIMGMATFESMPAAPFRLVARFHDNKGNHEIVLDKLECARD